MFLSTTVAPAILALAARALAAPSADRRNVVPTAVWESIEAAPAAWTKESDDADANEVIELRIQLAQQNMAQFQQMALDVRFTFPLNTDHNASGISYSQEKCSGPARGFPTSCLASEWCCKRTNPCMLRIRSSTNAAIWLPRT